MVNDSSNSISSVPLERPTSVRKYLPEVAKDGWILPDYVVGPVNSDLRYLFSQDTMRDLSFISPVVLYGDGPVGKTALAITLAVDWSRLTSKRPLCFTTGKNFSSEFSAAVEIDDTESFRTKHRDCQLLVIDDFEPLQSASAAQLELANTLDELHEKNRPVILTTKRIPASLTDVSSALGSRLSAGYSLQLNRPSKASTSEIVRRLCSKADAALPVDDVLYVCQHFDTQKLYVVDLKTIVLLCSQNLTQNGTFNRELVLKLALQHFASGVPTIPSIAKVVAKRMHVRLSELRGATREANIVRARGLAIHLARSLTDSSLQQIGQFFGGRDHSTVLHACRKTELLLSSDTELANMLRQVKSDLLVRRP